MCTAFKHQVHRIVWNTFMHIVVPIQYNHLNQNVLLIVIYQSCPKPQSHAKESQPISIDATATAKIVAAAKDKVELAAAPVSAAYIAHISFKTYMC